MSALYTTPIAEEQLKEFAEKMKNVRAEVIQDQPEDRAVEIIVDAMDDIEARIQFLPAEQNSNAEHLANAMKVLAEAYVMVKEANR